MVYNVMIWYTYISKWLPQCYLILYSLTSLHLCMFVSMVIVFKIYFPNNFQIYTTVLLIIVSILCIRFPELTHVTSLFSPQPMTTSILVFRTSSAFVDLYEYVSEHLQYLPFSVWLLSLSLMTSNSICVVKDRAVFLFMAASYFIVYSTHRIFLMHSFISGHLMFPCLHCCGWYCGKHGGAAIFLSWCFLFFG